jgi:hypothetical protein
MSIKFASMGYGPLEKELPSVGITPVILGIGHKNVNIKGVIQKSINMIGDTKPDILWLTKDTHITPQLIRKYKNTHPKMKVVMWYGDQRGNVIVPLIASRRGLLDALLITNEWKEQIKMYRKYGIKHVMPFYHSFPIEEFQLWDIPATYDVFFGGSRFNQKKFPLCPMRLSLIQIVHKKFKLVVHGGGWPFPTEKWILRPKYAQALRKAKVNLGINHYDIQCYFNRRLFESVASGRLHITHYIPGMEKYFVNKKHLVWFKTIHEGIELIRFYLKHNKERERIAKTGRDFFIERHSWPARVKGLRKYLERILQ